MPDPPAAMRERLLGKITLDVEVCEVNHRRLITLETADVRELLRQAAHPSEEKIEEVARLILKEFWDECLGDGNNADRLRALLREALGGG